MATTLQNLAGHADPSDREEKEEVMKMFAAALMAAVLGTICALTVDRIAADDDSGNPPLVVVWNHFSGQ